MELAEQIALLLSSSLIMGFAWFISTTWKRRTGSVRPNRKIAALTVMDGQAHWQRATSVVELSLTRATDMAAHHAAALRQLQAAEYALHALLSELGSVVKTSVTSPLTAREHALTLRVQTSQALAA